jgi:hypothetical protein
MRILHLKESGMRASFLLTGRGLLLAAAFLFLTVSGRAADYPTEYMEAVADARIAEVTLERIHTLTPITASNDALIWDGVPGESRVLVTSWVSGDYYDPYIGKEYTLSPTRELWVSVVPEVRRFCAANNIQASAAANRLEQLIGMPLNYGNIKFVEFWVRPADLFRPTPDPEITDTVAEYDFPEGVSEEHKAWFNANRDSTYTSSHPFPWTRLGYTYDWGATNKIGLSEYIIRRGSTIGVKSVTTTIDYCLGASGQPDILLRNIRLAKNVIWRMNKTERVTTARFPDVYSPWEIQGTGDFNADGKSDILWRNPNNGKNVIALMNGATLVSSVWIEETTPPWRMTGSGDFNADGKPDILWRNPSTGANVVWIMDGTTRTGMVDLENVATPWRVGAVADFDGDGQPDILWRNATTAQVVIMLMNGTTRKGMAWLDNVPAPWDVVGAADFDLDDSPDILWSNPNSGRNVLMLMTGTTKRQLVDLQATLQGWGWRLVGAGVFH